MQKSKIMQVSIAPYV